MDKIIFVQIFIPNIRKKWYNDGVDSLNDAERYLLLLIETSIEESKKLAKGDTIMEEYVNDAVNASNEEWFWEAYDKEWALKDQGIREGIEQERTKIIQNLNKKYGIDSIMEMTGLTKEEVIEYARKNAREEDFFGEAYDKKWTLKDQGIKEGIEIGIEQGIEQEKKQTAEKMLQEKLDIKLIEKITGLAKQEILNEKNN